MKLHELKPLLDPSPLRLETGFERFENGVVHIACRTDMHRCTGDMFEWWFRSRPDTERYTWWHPIDHVSSTWSEAVEGTHVGSIHHAEEFFTGLPSQKLAIQFRHPNEFFESSEYERARNEGRVSAAVCGRVGTDPNPARGAEGEVLGGRLLHIGRDTEWGLVLRSHFYMGQDLPAQGRSPQEIEQLIPDEFAQALLMHCYNEFVFLSRFLPSLYIAAHRDSRKIVAPW
ncbi:DAPG hydrolase family protein [Paraburkholderia sp. J67]|uniref:DAPG hydrolase family protein n=1 Tax=Paraburkholderia sp. J67 TaxID=2805435 RepID=UPI002ABE6661|nr:hydrolase [Paraburkholderia sp. J67]